jgi:hypothetical protein
MERPLGITVPNIEIKPDSDTGPIQNCTKQFHDNLLIFLELRDTMRI